MRQHHRPLRALPAAILLVASLIGAGSICIAAPKAAAERSCVEVPLTARPGWTISGTWADGGTVLLVVDAFNNKILRYTSKGDPLPALPEPLDSAFDNFTPSVIKSDGSDLLIELSNARLIRLGRNLTPIFRRDIIGEGQRVDARLEKVYQWDLFGGDLLLFGDVRRPQATPEEQWKSGFFRVPLNDPQNFQSLHEISPYDPARLFYRLGTPLIASQAGTGYMLLMEERPRIVRYKKGAAGFESLRSFPPELAVRPTLPAWSRFDDYAPLMQAVERSTMPVALLGWEGSLFVLGRRPAANGTGTEWLLSKIDPKTDTLVWTTTVPLPSAHHVTVVPGPKQWAFIQKGVAKGLFNQEVKSLYLVPASRLRGKPGPDLCR